MKLELRGVTFSYGNHPTLEGITLTVGEGEVTSIIGPNGSGKTTLLKCVNKILKPDKGVILLNGKDVSKMGSTEVARKVGYVPQGFHSSFPLTVFDTVLLGRRPYIGWAVSNTDKEITAQVLVLLGLERMSFRFFNELSGGEKQKVLLARAVAVEPEILLLDEPTANLDVRYQLEVLSLITRLVKERGLSALIAIHDINLACRFSDKIILIKKGKISAVGEPGSVITEARVEDVFGIRAVVTNHSGRPYIMPLAFV